ncbi:MAG: hypothetical protein WBA76_20595, partial [Phormidesmis sp.]
MVCIAHLQNPKEPPPSDLGAWFEHWLRIAAAAGTACSVAGGFLLFAHLPAVTQPQPLKALLPRPQPLTPTVPGRRGCDRTL